LSPAVAGAGGGLVAASPPGPVQLQCGRGKLLAPSGEQPADLADSRCQARAGSRRACSIAGRAPMPVVTGWLLATART
jgi:hypothetical protein